METYEGYQDPSLFVGLRNSLGFRLRLRTCHPWFDESGPTQIICQYKAFPRDRYRTNQ